MDRKLSIPVLYEDEDLLVVNKPAGLLVHKTGAKREEHTLIDDIVATRPAMKTVGDDPARPGLVHRLDKDVSGVMAIAKTQVGFEHLKKQFMERTADKTYVALVYKPLPRDTGTISFKIARSKARGRMTSRSGEQEGKEAITTYDVLDRFRTTTLVSVNIKTGRTHQIRAHFLGIGHPVVGDKLYYIKHMRHIRPIEIDRIFLHAKRLEIELIDGTRRAFEAPMPEELEAILKTLPKT